jgi:four helix bundle protein
MGVRNFTDLLIWKRARAWSKEIFWHASEGQFARDQRLVVQINDSSESVMSNIAEGFGRGTQEEFVIFLGYATGSLMETQSHLCAAYDLLDKRGVWKAVCRWDGIEENDRWLCAVDGDAAIWSEEYTSDADLVGTREGDI